MKNIKFRFFYFSCLSLVFVSCDGKIDYPVDPIELNSDKEITSFFIPAEANNLLIDISGVIDSVSKNIILSSKQWIDNPDLIIASFEATGKVTVRGVEQISDSTSNSFRNSIVYTVTAEDGSSIEYTVTLKSPMVTGLPVLKIDIDGALEVVEKTQKLPAKLTIIHPDNKEYCMNNEVMTIRGRGNSTWDMPKKPYRIDFPKKTSVFGLSPAKKWVLLANYQDPTLLMNDVAFELGRRFGLQYTHSSTHVDLYVNGEYRGNYQLTEQKEIGKGRVDIDENEGFLVEMDTYYDEDYKFKTNHLGLPIMVAGPDLNNISEMQYIKDAIQGLEDALYDSAFPNSNYRDITDVNSLIDFLLINEFVRNRELRHPKSTYCYKDKDSKILWGPLWDFDWAFGFNGYTYFIGTDVLYYQNHEYNVNKTMPGSKFFCKFFEDPEFRKEYKARWKEMKPQMESIVQYVDEMAIKLEKSQTENFEIWSPSTKITTYANLITQMKAWLEGRITILENKFEEKFED